MSTIEIIIGFDFGTKNIGIAIGQQLTGTARPLTVLKSHNGIPNWKDIEHIYNDWKPTILIVGLPLNIDGTEQPITILAKNFAKQLKTRFCSTVEMHDERFSTKEARINWLKYYFNVSSKYKKQKIIQINAISAEIILRSWLSKHQLSYSKI